MEHTVNVLYSNDVEKGLKGWSFQPMVSFSPVNRFNINKLTHDEKKIFNNILEIIGFKQCFAIYTLFQKYRSEVEINCTEGVIFLISTVSKLFDKNG